MQLSPRQWIEARRLAVYVGILSLLLGMLAYAGKTLLLNTTISMPAGIYRFYPLDRALSRGDMIAVCGPPDMARLAVERKLLANGTCAYHSAPLLKIVAAVGGDVVDVRDAGVRVNGVLLLHSRRLVRDSALRLIPRIPEGRYVLGADRIWLWTPNPRSWDSRYFGLVALENVRGFVSPLLVLGADENWSTQVQTLKKIPSNPR